MDGLSAIKRIRTQLTEAKKTAKQGYPCCARAALWTAKNILDQFCHESTPMNPGFKRRKP